MRNTHGACDDMGVPSFFEGSDLRLKVSASPKTGNPMNNGWKISSHGLESTWYRLEESDTVSQENNKLVHTNSRKSLNNFTHPSELYIGIIVPQFK